MHQLSTDGASGLKTRLDPPFASAGQVDLWGELPDLDGTYVREDDSDFQGEPGMEDSFG